MIQLRKLGLTTRPISKVASRTVHSWLVILYLGTLCRGTRPPFLRDGVWADGQFTYDTCPTGKGAEMLFEIPEIADVSVIPY